MAYKSSYTFTAVDNFSQKAIKISNSIKALNSQLRATAKLSGSLNKIRYGNLTVAQKKVTSLTNSLQRLQQKASTGVNFNTTGLSGRVGGFGGGGGGGKGRIGRSGFLKGGAFGAGLPMLARNFLPAYLLVRGASAAVTQFAELETSLSATAALTGASVEQMDMLKSKTFELAKAYGGSALDMAEGMRTIGNANPELLKSTKLLGNFTAEAALLAAAGGDTLEGAGDTLTKMMASFNVKPENIHSLVDLLAAGARAGNLEVPQFSKAMTKFGELPKQMGFSAKDLVGMMELGGKGFIGQPAQEARMMRKVFQGMVKLKIPTNVLGAKGSWDVVNKKVMGFGDTAKGKDAANAWLQKAFGIEAAPLVMTMLDEINQKTADGVGKWDDMANSLSRGGQAAEQASIRQNTLQKHWEKMGSEFANLSNSMMTDLEPSLIAAVDQIGKLANALDYFYTTSHFGIDNLMPDGSIGTAAQGAMDTGNKYWDNSVIGLLNTVGLNTAAQSYKDKFQPQKVDVNIKVDQNGVVTGVSTTKTGGVGGNMRDPDVPSNP